MTTHQEAFEQQLFQLIPQTKNLGIQIKHLGDNEIVVNGAYQLNKNHLDIVFGGSIAAISITTAWSFLQHKIQQAGLVGHLVIKQQEIAFLLPVKSDFVCTATLQSQDDWSSLVERYQQRGRAKITVTAQITCQSKITSTFQGIFVLYQ